MGQRTGRGDLETVASNTMTCKQPGQKNLRLFTEELKNEIDPLRRVAFTFFFFFFNDDTIKMDSKKRWVK